MSDISVARPSHSTAISELARWGAITGVVAGAIFLVWPEADLSIASLFYIGDGRFFGEQSVIVQAVRNLFMALYVIAVTMAVVALALTSWRRAAWLGVTQTQWLFVALCLVIGPGLVANQIFKDNWGRARPQQVMEFGGDKPFTAAIVPARNCARNCSFISGEASSIFALFFAAAALLRRRWRTWIVAGIVAGSCAGLMRMAQGAHFLSDIVFAGVFMALTVAGLFMLIEAANGRNAAYLRMALFGSGVR